MIVGYINAILGSLPFISFLIMMGLSISLLLDIAGYISFVQAIFMVYATYFLASSMRHFVGLNEFSAPIYAIVFIGTIGVCGVLSMGLYIFPLNRLHEDVYRMITTFGILIALGEIPKLVWGYTPIIYSTPVPTFGKIAGVSGYNIFCIVFVVGTIAVLYHFLYRTNTGLSFRAMSEDVEMSGAVGIDSESIRRWVFFISGALAGIAGLLIVPTTAASYGMQSQALLFGFMILIVAGVGSLWGTVLAGFILGAARTIMGMEYPIMTLPIIFIIATIVLVVRPRGLFGHAYEH